MNCVNCGAPAIAGDRFCGNCGADMSSAQQPVPQQAQPAQQAQPTQPMPQQPAAAAQPGAPGYAVAPPPPAGSSTGVVIALSIVGVLLVAGIGVGGYFAWRAMGDDGDETPVASVEATGTAQADATGAANGSQPEFDPEPIGYPSPLEALESEIPSDWVWDYYTNSDELVEYVVGPPASEYTTVVVTERQRDDTWLVVETFDYYMDDIDAGTSSSSGGTSGGSTSITSAALSPEDEATQVVGEFLYAVKQDRALDAHAYTISPFAEDPASSMYSNGDLKSFEVVSSVLQNDGATVHVRSSERWAWGTEAYIYVCVPTNAGYRISELRIP